MRVRVAWPLWCAPSDRSLCSLLAVSLLLALFLGVAHATSSRPSSRWDSISVDELFAVEADEEQSSARTQAGIYTENAHVEENDHLVDSRMTRGLIHVLVRTELPNPDDPELAVNCTYDPIEHVVWCSANGTSEIFVEPEKNDTGWRLGLDIGIAAFLVIFAGICSGLTIGLLSMDPTNLKIISKAGDETAKRRAALIYPLVKRHHQLLVTLLLANAFAMESLPIFLDRAVGPIIAVILSVTCVLLFGEIIPQALCSRFGLAIGASLFWFVWILMVITFPLSFPLGKLLDCVLGHEEGTYYARKELKELVHLHGNDDQFDPDGRIQNMSGRTDHLTHDEITIIKGALDMTHKCVVEAMTPIENVFMLPLDGCFDEKTMTLIVDEGHSRVPVYRESRENIIGMILVKKCLLYSPKDCVPIAEIPLHRMPVVNDQLPLYDLLNLFQTGKSHMAIVVSCEDHLTVLGAITLEDVLEELIQEEIIDETDVYEDVARQIRLSRALLTRPDEIAFRDPTALEEEGEAPVVVVQRGSDGELEIIPMGETLSARTSMSRDRELSQSDLTAHNLHRDLQVAVMPRDAASENTPLLSFDHDEP
eukprot:CAMPEP_0174239140 /NCGR_PEP_ID=MMETSP0417-20130205/13568_1 /TAXON_ID=242541 /ORGANISM="Mayorella sp, Strain BSH-02190019" /LENGTH=592 /DNA_ID=CAMNT_0015318053 /DNA_START=67 /DNA_END=1845 /DNA_ORIENTATION=-